MQTIFSMIDENVLECMANAVGLEYLGGLNFEEHSEVDYLRIHHWLREGLHGDMKYLERASLDPRDKYPWANAAMFFALPYPRFDHTLQVGYGWISAYALWRDYHKVFQGRLKQICSYLISEFPEHHFKGFSDAVPIFEKALAKNIKENIFQGKNTLLIHRDFGSYFLLAEILTSAKLRLRPVCATKMRCGPCVRCEDNCPTQALGSGYLDSRKCISYLTIEYKGYFSADQIPMVGYWLFGCDICQTVCPFNHRLSVSPKNGFFQNERRTQPYFPLSVALNMNEATFFETFRGTPVMRAKRSGFVRNAIAAATNQKCTLRVRDYDAQILRLTKDNDPVVAITAENALRIQMKKKVFVIFN